MHKVRLRALMPGFKVIPREYYSTLPGYTYSDVVRTFI